MDAARHSLNDASLVDASPADHAVADARANMVDGQLRPNKVNDRRVLDAMRRLPREAFLPAGSRAMAYIDAEIAAGEGRFLLEPMVVARLVQAAELRAGSNVLVIGAGYAAAVVAACGPRVTVLEQDAQLETRAAAAYRACDLEVTIVQGKLAAGWPSLAPYECILIDGAVRVLPPLQSQLSQQPSGRLCAVLVATGRQGVAVVAERVGDALACQPVMDCSATAMEEFSAPAGFRF